MTPVANRLPPLTRPLPRKRRCASCAKLYVGALGAGGESGGHRRALRITRFLVEATLASDFHPTPTLRGVEIVR